MARNGRFEAAKSAALTFLDSVPDDVEVGIVTFDGAVSTALEPTTDRAAAEIVVNSLALSRGTLLYDGILASVDLAGVDGQRSILVLSDGADTGAATSLEDVTATIDETATLVDVVSLDQSGPTRATAALSDLAAAGQGRVIAATGAELADAFAAEAAVLAEQVLVTAPLPDGFGAPEATVRITLPTAGGEIVASALARIQDAPDEGGGAEPAPVEPETVWRIPDWALPVGLGVFGFGLLTVALLLVPGKPKPMTIDQRVSAYTHGGNQEWAESAPSSDPVLDQARAAAAGVLDRNKGLEEKLATRLVAAGSSLKPSEWLLLHVGIVVGAALLGLLVGRGNLIIALLFVIAGIFLPRFYLRWKASRRRKSFDAALPETLQLMAGALSAGMSLAQSVDTVVREGPEVVATEFKRVLVETRIGLPLEDAFDGVAERFQSKDFSWAVMAIRIQRQVGGNLAELLNTVADTMREREYLRRQVKTLAAEGKLSAVILCAMPPVFMVFVLLTRREYMMPLFTEPMGLLLLGAGCTMLTLGVLWMSRLVKVEV
jgi:tight adherence protein B